MVCYAVCTVAAIAHVLFKNKIPLLKNNPNQTSLTLLLLGGSIFGIVDHWWNGELFFIGENLLSDLALGLAITTAIVLTWAILLSLEKIKLKTKATA